MKRLLLPVLTLPFLLLVPVSCEDKPNVTVAPKPPVPKKKPKVYSPADVHAEAAARQAALDKEIADLETEAEKLRLEIAQEQLAQDQAALAEDLVRLEAERTRLLQSLAQATPQPTAALPPDKPKASTAYPITTQPVADFSLFYTELTAHGRWFQSTDYGYVWQPTLASQSHSTWRPYTQGRWASCDRGWIWLSDEPFGWATYHYGRWACLKEIGWIWVPGETWGPAWVAWRKNDEHIGWCPLPPETLYHGEITYDATVDKLCGIRPDRYIFIAIKRFCEPVHRHCEPADRSPVICRNTTNITRLQITRRGVERCGPSYDWIRARLTGDQPRYTLTGLPQRQGPQHYHFQNNQLCVFSPVMRAPWNATLRPAQVAGSVPPANKTVLDAPPPDKLRQRYQEGRKAWETAAQRAMKEAPVRRLTERQEQIATRQATLAQGPQTRPGSDLPAPARATPVANANRPAAGAQTTAQRRELRESARQELAEQKAALARLRGEPDPTPSPPPRVQTAGPIARPQPVRTPAVSSQNRPAPVAVVQSPGPGITPAGVNPTNAPGEPLQQSVNPPAVTPQGQVMEQPGRLVAGNPDIPTPELQSAEITPPVIPDAPAPPSATDLAQQDRIAQLKEEIAQNRQVLQRPAPPVQPNELPAPNRPRPDREDRNQPTSRPEQTRQDALARAAELRAQQAELQAQQAALLARQQEAAQQKALQDQAALAQQETEAANQLAQQNAETQQQAAMDQAARQQEAIQQKELTDRQRLAMDQTRQQQELAEQQQQRQELARQQETLRQQQELADRQRLAGESAQNQELAIQQQQAAEQQRQAEAAARQQQDMAVQQQQAAEQLRQAEAAARQQEMARQQQEAAERQRQAEEAARQQEMARQQQEAAERQRQAEEAARQQEMARQQQEAAERQRQAEESARQQEMARQQQEAAERQRQAEEAARQQEMARQQQEAAERQRQAAEAARQQEQARQQQEAAERARQEEANRQQKEKEQGGRP